MSDLSSRNDSKLIPKYLVKCNEGRDYKYGFKGEARSQMENRDSSKNADTQRSARLTYQVISKVLNLFLTVVTNRCLGNRNLLGSKNLQLINFKTGVLVLY